MPVGILRYRKGPRDGSAADQVQAWTRERFALAGDATVVVAEVACSLPGCPPVETVVVFWGEGGTRHQFKLFKPIVEVVEDDLPPRWLKRALVVDEWAGLECC
jgi:nitrate reductase delta subunit